MSELSPGNSDSEENMDATVENKEHAEATACSQPNISQGQEEKTENMTDLELVYKDQGYHEMEFTFGHESDLHERKRHCQKNPQHETFIPATHFAMQHLPEHWRESLVFEYITALISVTVRLAVNYTSTARPPNYPLCNSRGKNVTAHGSGWILGVARDFTLKEGRSCPCNACKQSPNPANQWGAFHVCTAKHVVFDSSEARHTKCNLFYDGDEDKDSCPSLEGVEVVLTDSQNIDDDYSVILCITHDEDVCSKLTEKIHCRDEVSKKMQETYKKPPSNLDRDRHVEKNLKKHTVVVISHPHGLSKHVTVGEVTHKPEGYPWTWRFKEKGYSWVWKYSAETCPGSSGGYVCLLGVWGDGFSEIVPSHAIHSGCRQRGHNESTGDWP